MERALYGLVESLFCSLGGQSGTVTPKPLPILFRH